MLWETSWQYEHIIVRFHFSSLLFLLHRQSLWINSSCSNGMCILKMLYFSAVKYMQYVVMLSQLLGLFQGTFIVLGTGYSNRSIHLFDSRYENPWETKQLSWNFVNVFQFWLKMDKKTRFFQCAPMHILVLILKVTYAYSSKNVSNKSRLWEEWDMFHSNCIFLHNS